MIMKYTAPSRPFSWRRGKVENLSQMVCEVVTVEITLGLVMTRLPAEFVETTGTTGLISSPVVPPVKPKADTKDPVDTMLKEDSEILTKLLNLKRSGALLSSRPTTFGRGFPLYTCMWCLGTTSRFLKILVGTSCLELLAIASLCC